MPGKDYSVIGEPEDLAAAHQLAQDDRFQFQWWALSLIQARQPGISEGDKKAKKGADQGIDGVVFFFDDPSQKLKRILVQVKSGHVKSGDIRDLRGVLDREKDAAIGVFITLEKPSSAMETEAISAGFYKSPIWEKEYPRIQILTIEELLKGAEVKMPPSMKGAFKEAKRVKKSEGEQQTFNF